MKKTLAIIAGALALSTSTAAIAELPVGAKAPVFSTNSALAGKAKKFDLRKALKRGPVVLYFYPKAFTHGCTLETRAFADAHDEFARQGATVLGLSADDIGTLKRFSTEACRNKFAVGVAGAKLIAAYDVALKREGMPANVSDRTSYVIGQDGRIAFVHSDLDYRDHVKLTLKAVKALRAKAR